MPRDSPHRDGGRDAARFRDDDRRDRYPRRDGEDDYRGGSRRQPEYGRDRGGPSRVYDDGPGKGVDRGGDGTRDRDRYSGRDRDRGGGRGRDRGEDDRRRDRGDDRLRERERDDERNQRRDRSDRDTDRDRDSRRPGPSRRSASPRQRSSKPGSRSHSRPGSEAAEDKAKPNFVPSGLLAAATKTVQHGDGTKTVLKYHEPPEARKPSVGWRLYVFKGKEQVDLLHIHRQSAYLIGRDRAIVDISIDHPSCSKQHAVIQYRQVQEKNEFGDVKTTVKPFIIDLESTNGTIVNDAPIPTSRYVELVLGDVIKFGESAREYVLLSEDAA